MPNHVKGEFTRHAWNTVITVTGKTMEDMTGERLIIKSHMSSVHLHVWLTDAMFLDGKGACAVIMMEDGDIM